MNKKRTANLFRGRQQEQKKSTGLFLIFSSWILDRSHKGQGCLQFRRIISQRSWPAAATFFYKLSVLLCFICFSAGNWKMCTAQLPSFACCSGSQFEVFLRLLSCLAFSFLSLKLNAVSNCVCPNGFQFSNPPPLVLKAPCEKEVVSSIQQTNKSKAPYHKYIIIFCTTVSFLTFHLQFPFTVFHKREAKGSSYCLPLTLFSVDIFKMLVVTFFVLHWGNGKILGALGTQRRRPWRCFFSLSGRIIFASLTTVQQFSECTVLFTSVVRRIPVSPVCVQLCSVCSCLWKCVSSCQRAKNWRKKKMASVYCTRNYVCCFGHAVHYQLTLLLL